MSSVQGIQKDQSQSFDKGLALYYQGDYSGALSFFQDFLAHEDEPTRTQAIGFLAHIFFDCDQSDQALSLLTEGLKMVPHHTDLLVQKADFLTRLNRASEARELLQNTLSQVQQNDHLWAMAAEVCLKEGNGPWANTCAQRALDYNGKNDRASHVMSTLAVGTEDFHEAEHINFHMLYNADLEHRASGNGHVNMANAFLRRGVMPMALHHYAQRHSETSECREYYFGLDGLQRLKSFDEAVGPALIASEGDALYQLRMLGLLTGFLKARAGDVIEVHPMLVDLVQQSFAHHRVTPQNTRPYFGRPVHIYENLEGIKRFMLLGDVLGMVDDFKMNPWIVASKAAPQDKIGVFVGASYAEVLAKSPLSEKLAFIAAQDFDSLKSLSEIAGFLGSFKGLILEPSLLKELAQGVGVSILEIAPKGYVWHFGAREISPFAPSTKLCVMSAKQIDEDALLQKASAFIAGL